MSRERSSPTIYEVAAAAGVSISTVSLALNHPGRVSPATRRRVAEAAQELGYRSGPRTGSGGRSGLRTIAVAAPFSSWPSYYTRLDGVLPRAAAAGLEVLVHDLPSSSAVAAPLLDALPVRGDIDGVIIMGSPLSAAAEDAIRRAGIPTVLVDSTGEQLPSVTTDDRRGGQLLGEHLAGLGHRTVVFAHDGQVSDDYVSSGMHRLDGLTQALTAAGGTVEPMLADPELPARALAAGATAVVANHDDLAASILAGASAAGIDVPGDLSLTGYDGGPLAAALGLTTIAQPLTESGAAAADLLLALLAGTSPAVRTVSLDCRLLPGRTTTAPR